MIILGVDPGVAITGYALLKSVDKSTKILDYGNIQTDRSSSFPLRLKKIYDEISQLIEQYRPQTLALEDVFYAQNIKTALKMGHVRAVTLLAAVNNDVAISEFSPREVKLAVTGYGAASKEQVQKMVVHLLNLPQLPSSYDVTDAMAVAICHCNRTKKIQINK